MRVSMLFALLMVPLPALGQAAAPSWPTAAPIARSHESAALGTQAAERGPEGVSGPGAFLRSLLLPGLGHRYVDGRWGTGGTLFAFTDAALWTSLFGVTWRRSNLVDTYEALAVSRAGADMEGKNRTFVLRLASYRSSDEFVEVALRNRAWEDLSYVEDPSYRWEWESDEDFLRFRDLRDDAESLGRRRTLIVASLVANRVLSGFMASRRARSAQSVDVALVPSPNGRVPGLDLSYRF